MGNWLAMRRVVMAAMLSVASVECGGGGTSQSVNPSGKGGNGGLYGGGGGGSGQHSGSTVGYGVGAQGIIRITWG